MITDRELLEWAAKAAVIRHITPSTDYNGSMGLVLCDEHGRHGPNWNPLIDDGDRLRLARRLVISIDFADCCAWKRMPNGDLIQEFWGGDCGDEAHAVLRVAAEIGKNSAPSAEEKS